MRGYIDAQDMEMDSRLSRDKLRSLTKETMPVPAIQPYIIEPIWEQFCALLPEREVNHPLGCHRPRIPNRVVFEKLVQVLVFGCAYWRINAAYLVASGACTLLG